MLEEHSQGSLELGRRDISGILQHEGFDIFDRLKINISKGDICFASNRATKAASPIFAWSVNVHSALIKTAVHRSSLCLCRRRGSGGGRDGRGRIWGSII